VAILKRRLLRSSKQLLLVLLFGIACFIFTCAMYLVNARVDSGYGGNDGHFIITNIENNTTESAILNDGWIFVPNVDYTDIDNGDFHYYNYSSRPYADHISISYHSGWYDLGDNTIWHNTDESPEYEIIERDGKHKISAVYMGTLHFERTDTTYHLNIPEANGLVVVYCNGVKLGTIWNRIDEWTPSVGFGYGHVPIIPDENGNAEIIIAVSASDSLFNPGILGAPSVADAGDSYKFVVIPVLWYAIQVMLFFFLLVGGLLISRTYKQKSHIYILLFIEILVLFIEFVDCHFLTQTSLLREETKYSVMILISIFLFQFINSLIKASYKTAKRLNLTRIFPAIVGAIGLTLILICIFDNTITSASFPHITGFGYSALILILSLILMSRLKKDDPAVIFSGIALVCYIMFVLCLYSVPSGIINVPLYSFTFIIANLVVEVFYIVRYVTQARELEETNKRMHYLVKEKTQHISEINRDLYNTNKRLMENEAARKNVLSNVSHDLRTPITAIRGYAELLISSGDKMNDNQRLNYLNNIIKRATQMERIISDIVELTRLESNVNEFQFTDVSLSELLDEICMMYEADLEHTKKTLTLNIPDSDPLIVRADPKKISRVFENLISNAINYSFEEADIKVNAWREGDSKDVTSQIIKIDVIDNGIGIPEDEIKNIFDRFYRAKNSGQNIKGTGIGLSIVKTIIDHHDAQITVESTIGVGTTFHITMKATYN